MKSVRNITFFMAFMLTMTTLSASAKNIMVPKAYMFGFVSRRQRMGSREEETVGRPQQLFLSVTRILH